MTSALQHLGVPKDPGDAQHSFDTEMATPPPFKSVLCINSHGNEIGGKLNEGVLQLCVIYKNIENVQPFADIAF